MPEIDRTKATLLEVCQELADHWRITNGMENALDFNIEVPRGDGTVGVFRFNIELIIEAQS
jgi:hypothetical protein